MGMNTDAVQRLYVAYFNRPADPVSMSVYESLLPADRVATQAELQALAETYFSPSTEYTNLFAGMSNTQIINQLYQNIFGREAEPTGLTYWAAELTAGRQTVASIALQLSYSAQGTDADVVSNRIEAANSFTTGLDTTAEITGYSGDAAAASARAWLATVGSDTSSKDAAIAGVDTAISNAVAAGQSSSAQSFTLTTNADLFTGGAGDDIFTAVDTTLQVIDQIDGAGGTSDSLYFTDTSNGGGIAATAISNIEHFYIRNVQTGNAGETYDFGALTGETQVWHDRATDSSTFTGLSAGTTVGLKGDGSTVLGALTFQYATASSAVAIALDGGVGAVGAAPDITESGTDGTATAATISSTGAANTVGTVDLANATLTSVTITADTNLSGDLLSQATNQVGTNGTVTISGAATSVAFTAALDDTIKTIDASGLTGGGVTATLGSLATQSFTGGGGNDTITLGGDQTSGVIDGGDGTGDTLVLAAASNLDTATEAALFTNWEILRTANSFDMGLLSSLTGLQISATGGATTFSNLSATEAGNIQILGAINAAGVSFALADGSGTADSLTLKLGNNLAAAGTSVDADSLTLNLFETLNLEAVHGASATAGGQRTATVADFTADKLTSIVLTGSAFDLENVATTKAVTIDATALTGDGAATTLGLTAAGSLVAGSTVKGSEVGDTFTIGAAGSTYNGNGGADGFTTTQTIVASTNINGGAGTDTLTLTDDAATTATLTIADNTFKNVAEIDQLVLSGATAGDLVWNLGGYANDFAQAAGGTLKVTAANFASGATLDVITVDASGLGTGSALHLVLTNTVATVGGNAGTDTFTGSDGNDIFTINYDANNANDDSIVTISAGAGDDTITFTMGSGTSTPGTITLTGGAGNDTITGSVEIDTITGGAGTDTMAGGTGNDIFVITTASDSNAATAGAIDKITDFAGGGGDDLKVGVAATELNAETATTNFASLDTIAELNAALNSTNGTLTTAKFDGTGEDAALITTSDARILLAIDIDASGTFTAADVVVELTGLTGTLAAGDIIA